VPTLRGRIAIGAGAAFLLLWIGLGDRLLLATGALLLVAVLAGVISVRRAAPRVAVARRLLPPRVHVAHEVAVETTVRSRRPLRAIRLTDPIAGLGAAHAAPGRIDPARPLRLRYTLRPPARGVFPVGPADVRVRDLLGMAESGGTVGPVDRLVVFPEVETLEGLPSGGGPGRTAAGAAREAARGGDDEFFALREYTDGDDLRQVHWRSSAKRDTLMIRQNEASPRSRALLLLDRRAAAYGVPAAFEHAVVAAASVLRHLFTSGYRPLLWTGEGPEIHVTEPDDLVDAMEVLAGVATCAHASAPGLLSRLRRGGGADEIVVLVTGLAVDPDPAVLQVLLPAASATVVVAVAPPEIRDRSALARTGAVTVYADPAEPWAPAWRTAMGLPWATGTAG